MLKPSPFQLSPLTIKPFALQRSFFVRLPRASAFQEFHALPHMPGVFAHFSFVARIARFNPERYFNMRGLIQRVRREI